MADQASHRNPRLCCHMECRRTVDVIDVANVIAEYVMAVLVSLTTILVTTRMTFSRDAAGLKMCTHMNYRWFLQILLGGLERTLR